MELAQFREVAPAMASPLDDHSGGISGLEMDVQLVPSLDLRECPGIDEHQGLGHKVLDANIPRPVHGLDVVGEGISLDVRHILPAARSSTLVDLLLPHSPSPAAG
jgi:hypothetical protein